MDLEYQHPNNLGFWASFSLCRKIIDNVSIVCKPLLMRHCPCVFGSHIRLKLISNILRWSIELIYMLYQRAEYFLELKELILLFSHAILALFIDMSWNFSSLIGRFCTFIAYLVTFRIIIPWRSASLTFCYFEEVLYTNGRQHNW